MIRFAIRCALIFGLVSAAQVPGRAALEGTYRFVLLEAAGVSGAPTSVRTLAGEAIFAADGSYSLTGEQSNGVGPRTPFQGTGSHQGDGWGQVLMTSPLTQSVAFEVKIGADGDALLGVDSTAGGSTWSMFAAVRKGDAAVAIEGDYAFAKLGFHTATDYDAASIRWTNVADGKIGAVFTSGRARGGARLAENLGEAVYALDETGSGAAQFSASGSLLAGAYTLFASPDGAFVIGTSEGAARDVLIGVRIDVETGESFRGRRYWLAEINLTGGLLSTATGAVFSENSAIALLTERLRLPAGSIDFTGMNFFGISEGSGRGWFASEFLDGVENMAIGAADGDGAARGLVSAQFGPFDEPGAVSPDLESFGIFFAVEAPQFEQTAQGPSIDPLGVVNGASFALHPNPIAEGSIVSVFGDGFAAPDSGMSATAFPLPFEMLGASVTVDGVLAPLFYVSQRQINLQLPRGLDGGTVEIVVTAGGVSSEPAQVKLATTSPGVFSFITQESYHSGIVIHADGTLVSGFDPASPGETVVIFVSGLGESVQPVEAGLPYPSDPLPWLSDMRLRVYFGGVAGQILYAGGAPGFAGLQQINVTIPAGTPIGLNVPVAVQTANAYHDQADIPIFGVAALSKEMKAPAAAENSALPPRARIGSMQ